MMHLSGGESVQDGTYKFISWLDSPVPLERAMGDAEYGLFFHFLIFLVFVWELCVIYKVLSLVSGRW